MNSPSHPKLRQLKTRAQKLKPVIHVGHDGLSPRLLAAIEQALADHGLIKIRFTDHKGDRKQLSADIAAATGAQIVLLVGHTVTIYREPVA